MISIIITSYKEPDTIGKAISSFLEQNIKEKFEILVLAPDKETLESARKIKSPKLRVIKDKGDGKPAALNLAFSIAKGSILVLTDGDVYTETGSVSELLKPFRDEKMGAVSGRPVSLESRSTMLGFWSHLLVDAAHRVRQESYRRGEIIVCSGYLYAIRKGIIKKIPTDALADDAVISHMIHDEGYKTGYAENARVFVKYPNSFSDWIKQKKRSAGGYNQLACMVQKKERMRSFSKESLGVFKVLSYPKTLTEYFYTFALILARAYLWALIFIDINIRKKEFKKIWVRVDSTK